MFAAVEGGGPTDIHLYVAARQGAPVMTVRLRCVAGEKVREKILDQLHRLLES